MADKRVFASRTREPSSALRIALPCLILTALGAGAVYLASSPSLPAEAETLPLVTTGLPKSSTSADTTTASSPTARSPIAAESARASAMTDSAPIPTAVVSPVAAQEPETDCPLVNGFTITITSGSPTCDEVMEAAQPYTDAVLGPDALFNMGRALIWSGNGWDCVRNYDSTGVTANAHGLVCSGAKGAFLLVSE